MKREDGIQLWLSPKTEIPDWVDKRTIRKQTVKTEAGEHREIRVLRIKGVEARLDLGGSVSLKILSARGFIFSFPLLAVLQIRDVRGNLRAESRFFCARCFENSGELSGYSPSFRGGLGDPIYQCSVCSWQWRIKD